MLPAASQLLQSMPMTAAGDILKLLRLTLTAHSKPADIEFAYLGDLAAVSPGEPFLIRNMLNAWRVPLEGLSMLTLMTKVPVML